MAEGDHAVLQKQVFMPSATDEECHDACFVADSTQENQTLANVSGLLSMFFGERSEASNHRNLGMNAELVTGGIG